MTDKEEKDMAQMERDAKAADNAAVRKSIYQEELDLADDRWFETCTRLRKAIDQCIAIIEGTKHDG